MLKAWFFIALWKRIFVALILGALFGLLTPELIGYVKPLGDIFLNAIRMLIIPLVVSTLITGVASNKDVRALGRLGLATFLLYLATTAVAISIGLVLGNLFQPGVGLQLQAAAPIESDVVSLVDSVVAVVPSNPVRAMADGDVLPVIVFSILFGIGIVLAGDRAAPLTDMFEAVAQVMFKLTHIVMELAPFGVFALIASVMATVGMAAIVPLSALVAVVCLACLMHIILVYGSLLRFVAGRRVIRSFRGMLDAQILAFTTTSSSATLPVTISCATQHLGVDKSTAAFVLPLGATINMDGTAIYMGVAALFTAQAYGIDLSAGSYATIVVTATLASIGTAGVPGAGLIMMSIVFSSAGLPLEAIGLIAGVDRFLDMFRTATNITGDITIAAVIDRFMIAPGPPVSQSQSTQ